MGCTEHVKDQGRHAARAGKEDRVGLACCSQPGLRAHAGRQHTDSPVLL